MRLISSLFFMIIFTRLIGTPIVNRLEDLFSLLSVQVSERNFIPMLIDFTGNSCSSTRGPTILSSARMCSHVLLVKCTVYEPSRFITLPFLSQDPKAIEVVQVILETVLLRREKTMRDRDGKRIVDLPPKEVRIRPSLLASIFMLSIGSW